MPYYRVGLSVQPGVAASPILTYLVGVELTGSGVRA